MPYLRISLLVLLACASAHAGSLTFSGVLGNSGEKGATLVKFGLAPANGLGVICDKYGTLWDRAGDGILNRYASDGRLVATYPIASSNLQGDSIALNGDQVILLLNRKLYALSVDAPSGTAPADLGIEADLSSRSVAQGKLSLLRDNSLLLLDLASKSEQTILNPTSSDVRGIEIRSDGSVVTVNSDRKCHLIQDGKEATTDGWPHSSPGTPLQFLDNYWYGFNWNGTIHRLNSDFEADPGVILGGGSGAFIGHVDGNAELGSGKGLASMGADNFAVSGFFGTMHLMHWDKEKAQMQIIRRVGAIPACTGLALNRQGDIWFNVGRWRWSDGPMAPLQDCIGANETGQVTMLPNDYFVGIALRGGMNLETGRFTFDVHLAPLKTEPPKPVQASVVYPVSTNEDVFLSIDNQGSGCAYGISPEGEFHKIIGPMKLAAVQPVADWTSLAMKDKDTMLAGADGHVLELVRDGPTWRETKRWNSWGSGDDAHFGARLFLSADGDHLWVSDTQRHRVLCFSLGSGNLIASYGHLDASGNDLAHLNSPQVIIGREKRAVFFDSGNQRLVKLMLGE